MSQCIACSRSPHNVLHSPSSLNNATALAHPFPVSTSLVRTLHRSTWRNHSYSSSQSQSCISFLSPNVNITRFYFIYLLHFWSIKKNEIIKAIYYPVDISTTVFSYSRAMQYHTILHGAGVIARVLLHGPWGYAVRILATTMCFN